MVDTGYYKCKMLDPTTGMETLKTVPVSKQQADQRRGRAGRTGPGQCYRIYPEDMYVYIYIHIRSVCFSSPHSI